MIIYLIVIIVFLGSFLTFCLFLFIRGLYKLKSKGGSVKIRAYLSIFFTMIFFLVSFFLLSIFNIDTWIKYIIAYVITCLLFYVLIPIISSIIKFFPKESKLKLASGPRKLNKRLIIILILSSFVLAIVFFILIILNIVTNPNSALGSTYSKLFSTFLIIALMLLRLPNAYKQQINNLGQLENISFVLYLRGFKNENDGFYFGKYLLEMGKTIKEIEADNNFNFVNVNFETYFSYQLKKEIGELVGLGNPEEFYAHESVRLLYTLEDWQEKLQYLLNTSRCIVILPCISNSIQFELTEILKLGFSQKVYFFTKPKPKSMFGRFSSLTNSFVIYKKTVKWTDFQQMLNDLGFNSSIFPSHGSVITLNSDNETKLLKENCRLPSEYVFAMKEDLISKNL